MKCKKCKENKHMSLFPPKSLYSRKKGDLCFKCFEEVNGKTYGQFVSELVSQALGEVSKMMGGVLR